MVRLEDPAAGVSGTGFILHTGKPNETVIVTNYHVVMAGEEFQAYVLTPDDRQMRVAGLGIVKIDAKNDLALLHTAGATNNAEGLRIARGVTITEPVMVVGYPAAGNGFSAVPEPEAGKITSTTRKFGQNTYIQTNANINHGNSGGSVVNACGEVVGVATAKAVEADRMGLLVPGDKVVALYDSWVSPAADAPTEIAQRIEELRLALSYGDPDDVFEVAGLVTRGYLKTAVIPDFEARYAEVLQIYASESQTELGRRPDQLSERESTLLLSHVNEEHLEPLQQVVLVLAALIQRGMDPRVALQRYLGAEMQLVFRGLTQMDSEKIQVRDDGTATVYVRVTDAAGLRRWKIEFKYERGSWQIDGFTAQR